MLMAVLHRPVRSRDRAGERAPGRRVPRGCDDNDERAARDTAGRHFLIARRRADYANFATSSGGATICLLAACARSRTSFAGVRPESWKRSSSGGHPTGRRIMKYGTAANQSGAAARTICAPASGVPPTSPPQSCATTSRPTSDESIVWAGSRRGDESGARLMVDVSSRPGVSV